MKHTGEFQIASLKYYILNNGFTTIKCYILLYVQYSGYYLEPTSKTLRLIHFITKYYQLYLIRNYAIILNVPFWSLTRKLVHPKPSASFHLNIDLTDSSYVIHMFHGTFTNSSISHHRFYTISNYNDFINNAIP
jgi:hypothetical protein